MTTEPVTVGAGLVVTELGAGWRRPNVTRAATSVSATNSAKTKRLPGNRELRNALGRRDHAASVTSSCPARTLEISSTVPDWKL